MKYKSVSPKTWQRTGCIITSGRSFSTKLDSVVTDGSLECSVKCVFVCVGMWERETMMEMSKCALIFSLLSGFTCFHRQNLTVVLSHCRCWTQTQFLIGTFHEHLFPCESAGMWGMTYARLGPFPPSSPLPIFSHTQLQLLCHFSLFHFVILSPWQLLSSPLLLRLRFPHFLSSFSEHFLLLPIIFSPLSTLKFPQIIAYMRAPLSLCSSGCIFCKNHIETSKPLGLFISCETPPPQAQYGGARQPLSTHQGVRLSLTTTSSPL